MRSTIKIIILAGLIQVIGFIPWTGLFHGIGLFEEFNLFEGAGFSQGTGFSHLRAAKDSPNIILMFADDISAKEFPTYHIPDPTYGDSPCKTPVLEKMGREGVQFKNFWATPLCHPSRGMIMSGRYAYQTQWWSNGFALVEGDPCEPMYSCHMVFPHLLRDAGYKTQMVGKWQIGGSQEGWDFDEYVFTPGKYAAVKYDSASGGDKKAYYWNPGFSLVNHPDFPESFFETKNCSTTWNDFAADIELHYVKDFISRKKDSSQKFMVYWPAHLGHHNWIYDMSEKNYAEVPIRDENGNWTGERSSIGMNHHVEYIDYLLGEVIDHCDSLGIMNNTIILFTTDNGTVEYGKGLKGQIRERGAKVPFIAYAPGTIPPMGEVNELANLADILPTLAELSGAIIPEDYLLDGISLVPFLTGQRDHHREWIYSYNAEYRMVRTRDVVRDGIGRFWDTRGKASQENYVQIRPDPDTALLDDIALIYEVLGMYPLPDTSADSEMYARYLDEDAGGIKRWEDVIMAKDLQNFPAYDLSGYIPTFRTASTAIPEMMLYPNPVQNVLHFRESENTPDATYMSNAGTLAGYVIFNQLGKQVLVIDNSPGLATVDVSILPAGVYFIRFEKNDDPSIMRMFIKQ